MVHKALVSQRHNGQDLPPPVHTDWRLSESAACLKDARKAARYCHKAGALETCGRKTCIPVTFRLHLTFRDSLLEVFGQIFLPGHCSYFPPALPCSEAALTTLKSTRMWDRDACSVCACVCACVCVCVRRGHRNRKVQRPLRFSPDPNPLK